MSNQKRVLIVEDEASLRNALKAVLERDGYDLTVATNGTEGLAVLDEKEIDLVILDIIMPKLDGINMLKQLRSHEKQPNVPVIILSNWTDGDTITEAEELGAINYLIKSDWDIEDVVSKIEEICGGDESEGGSAGGQSTEDGEQRTEG